MITNCRSCGSDRLAPYLTRPPEGRTHSQGKHKCTPEKCDRLGLICLDCRLLQREGGPSK